MLQNISGQFMGSWQLLVIACWGKAEGRRQKGRKKERFPQLRQVKDYRTSASQESRK